MPPFALLFLDCFCIAHILMGIWSKFHILLIFMTLYGFMHDAHRKLESLTYLGHLFPWSLLPLLIKNLPFLFLLPLLQVKTYVTVYMLLFVYLECLYQWTFGLDQSLSFCLFSYFDYSARELRPFNLEK